MTVCPLIAEIEITVHTDKKKTINKQAKRKQSGLRQDHADALLQRDECKIYVLKKHIVFLFSS